MSILSRLTAACCRVDGVQLNPDGSIGFATTNSGGAWSDAQKDAVLAALGMLPPVLTPQQQEARWAGVIQAWLDSNAQASPYGYNNIATAISYQNSSVDLWARQGAAFAAWRDAVWQVAFALLAEIQAGTEALPTSDADLIGRLPQPTSLPTS